MDMQTARGINLEPQRLEHSKNHTSLVQTILALERMRYDFVTAAKVQEASNRNGAVPLDGPAVLIILVHDHARPFERFRNLVKKQAILMHTLNLDTPRAINSPATIPAHLIPCVRQALAYRIHKATLNAPQIRPSSSNHARIPARVSRHLAPVLNAEEGMTGRTMLVLLDGRAGALVAPGNHAIRHSRPTYWQRNLRLIGRTTDCSRVRRVRQGRRADYYLNVHPLDRHPYRVPRLSREAVVDPAEGLPGAGVARDHCTITIHADFARGATADSVTYAPQA